MTKSDVSKLETICAHFGNIILCSIGFILFTFVASLYQSDKVFLIH
jgi:hypothetical protein